MVISTRPLILAIRNEDDFPRDGRALDMVQFYEETNARDSPWDTFQSLSEEGARA